MADTDEIAKLAVNKRPHAAIEDEEDGMLVSSEQRLIPTETGTDLGFQEMAHRQTMTLVQLYPPPMRRRESDASCPSRRST
jgi:hypothetical protein